MECREKIEKQNFILPYDMRMLVFSFLDEKALAACRASFSLFYHDINNVFCQRILQQKQLNKEAKQIFRNLFDEKIIKTPLLFFTILNRLPQVVTFHLKSAWEILCLCGEAQALNYAVNELKIDVNQINDLEETPLYLAILSGSTNAIEILRQKGAEFNLKDCSPIWHAAALSGIPNQLRALSQYEEKSGKNLPHLDRKFRHTIHFAAMSFNPDQVEAVQEITGVSLQVTDIKGNTIIDYASICNRAETITRYYNKMQSRKRPRHALEAP